MFEQLLIADLVVADISIHNANCFYELGIRHAFRDKRTFLIRSKVMKSRLISRQTAICPTMPVTRVQASPISSGSRSKPRGISTEADSPVFQLLPNLEPGDPSPTDSSLSGEDVERAQIARKCGDLQLLATETKTAWKTMGLRLIGDAQFKLKDWYGAKQPGRDYDIEDLEANTMLGTIYQRLDDLVGSSQARSERWETTGFPAGSGPKYMLMGRNEKTLWGTRNGRNRTS